MKRRALAVVAALAAMSAAAGSAVADTRNSTNGHHIDRLQWDRTLAGASHRHAPVAAAIDAERYWRSTETHARDRENADAVLRGAPVASAAPFDAAAPTQTGSGAERPDI